MWPWSRPISDYCLVRLSSPTFQPMGAPRAVLWQPGPLAPQVAPSLGSLVRQPSGFLQSLTCLLTSGPVHVFTGCLHPAAWSARPSTTPRAEQGRAWHGWVLCRHLSGVTLDGETSNTQPPPQVHLPLLLRVLTWWGQGTLAVGGERGRAGPPPLGGLGRPELVKTRRDPVKHL